MKHTAPFWSMGHKISVMHSEAVPGPGSYSPTASTLKSSPIYRLGTSKRNDLNKSSLTPGPGSYNLNKTCDSPSWTFYGLTGRNGGKSLKNTEITTNLASGSYNPSRSTSNKGNIFQRSRKSYLASRNQVPGPGDYQISPVKDSPAFSFRPKMTEKKPDNVPGPGNYDPKYETVKEKSPSWIVSRKDELVRGVNVPGPGSYSSSNCMTGPKWGFTKSDRGLKEKHSPPGPGAYEIKTLVGAPPSYVQI